MSLCQCQLYTEALTVDHTAAPMSRTSNSFFVPITMTCTAQLTSLCDGSSHAKGTLRGNRRDQSF